jgi:8-oxo-dGTP diphosphatase
MALDDPRKFKNPKPTVDVIVEVPGGIVLIERGHEPLGLAIPGGFIDEGEPVEAAAVREMKEELNLDVVLEELLYVYSDPRRDPRHHTLTTVFIGRPKNAGDTPTAGDDAKATKIVSTDALPEKMAFDHAAVLADYARFKKTGKRPDPMVFLERWRSRAT